MPDANPHKLALFNNLNDFLRKYITDDTSRKTILDFGSGPDGYVTLYAEDFGKAYAVDIYDYSDKYEDVNFLLSNGKDIPLDDNSVDLIVSHSCLEHVGDIYTTLHEMNRILRVGGHAYLTVSPLFYSSSGGHNRAAPPWAHLDDQSQFYIPTNQNMGKGAFLNRLTNSEFLSTVGTLPWGIVAHHLRPTLDVLPPHIDVSQIPTMDLVTREFRFIGRKLYDLDQ